MSCVLKQFFKQSMVAANTADATEYTSNHLEWASTIIKNILPKKRASIIYIYSPPWLLRPLLGVQRCLLRAVSMFLTYRRISPCLQVSLHLWRPYVASDQAIHVAHSQVWMMQLFQQGASTSLWYHHPSPPHHTPILHTQLLLSLSVGLKIRMLCYGPFSQNILMHSGEYGIFGCPPLQLLRCHHHPAASSLGEFSG